MGAEAIAKALRALAVKTEQDQGNNEVDSEIRQTQQISTVACQTMNGLNFQTRLLHLYNEHDNTHTQDLEGVNKIKWASCWFQCLVQRKGSQLLEGWIQRWGRTLGTHFSIRQAAR